MRLARTIEGEIVPRLLMSVSLARRSLTARTTVDSHGMDEDVNELARLLLVHDFSVASTYARIVRERMASERHISIVLLTPAAGLRRLESVMQELSANL